MHTYRTLEDRVVAAGGLLHVSMEELRDAEGAGKLGTHIRDAIDRHLAARQLHLLERRLPNDQRAMVWLISPRAAWGAMLLEVVAEIRRGERSAR